jgi:hypothetical protein
MRREKCKQTGHNVRDMGARVHLRRARQSAHDGHAVADADDDDAARRGHGSAVSTSDRDRPLRRGPAPARQVNLLRECAHALPSCSGRSLHVRARSGSDF